MKKAQIKELYNNSIKRYAEYALDGEDSFERSAELGFSTALGLVLGIDCHEQFEQVAEIQEQIKAERKAKAGESQ